MKKCVSHTVNFLHGNSKGVKYEEEAYTTIIVMELREIWKKITWALKGEKSPKQGLNFFFFISTWLKAVNTSCSQTEIQGNI